MTLIQADFVNDTISRQSAERRATQYLEQHGLGDDIAHIHGVVARIREIIDLRDLKWSVDTLIAAAWLSRTGLVMTENSHEPFYIKSARYAREGGASEALVNLVAGFGVARYLPEDGEVFSEFSLANHTYERGIRLDHILLVADLLTDEKGNRIEPRTRIRSMINEETVYDGVRIQFNRAFTAYNHAQPTVGWL